MAAAIALHARAAVRQHPTTQERRHLPQAERWHGPLPGFQRWAVLFALGIRHASFESRARVHLCSARGSSPDKGGAVCSVFEGSIHPDEPNSCTTFGTMAGQDQSSCSVFGCGLCSVIAGLANAECTTVLTDQDPNGVPLGTCSTMNVFSTPVAEPVLCSMIVLAPPSVLPPGADGKCAGSHGD